MTVSGTSYGHSPVISGLAFAIGPRFRVYPARD